MDILIRKAIKKDIEQIANIENTLEHKILSYDVLTLTLEKNTYYYFVALHDNNIIGYLAAEFLVDHFDLLAIAVLNEYRKKSVATKLLNELIKSCKTLNIQDIFLEVRNSNISAINFYEKHGFEKISIRKNYYSDTSEDAIIYKKLV